MSVSVPALLFFRVTSGVLKSCDVRAMKSFYQSRKQTAQPKIKNKNRKMGGEWGKKRKLLFAGPRETPKQVAHVASDELYMQVDHVFAGGWRVVGDVPSCCLTNTKKKSPTLEPAGP